jgi:basic membrane protein A
MILILGVLMIGQFSSVKAEPKQLATGRFGIIFATGNLGDKSFNDAAWRGKEMAEAKYGLDVVIDYVQPGSIAEFADYQNAYSNLGFYDLIICIGFLQTTALNDTAGLFPSQEYMLIDDNLPNRANVKGITFNEHEGSFLVGAMAAMTTAVDRIGFLGGLNQYLINKFLAGYTQGAEWVNPNITIDAVYSPDPLNPWLDPAGGKAQAVALNGLGADIIYAAAGATGLGVIEFANETDGVYAIGVDSDQDYLSPGNVLASMLKLVETGVFNSIDQVMQGTFQSDVDVVLGLAEDGVGISDMTYTQDIKNGDFFWGRYCETKTRGEWIDNMTAAILDGSIVVQDIPANVPAPTPFATACQPPTTTTTTDTGPVVTTTTTTTTTTTEAPTPGFEFLATIALLGCAVILLRRKLRR